VFTAAMAAEERPWKAPWKVRISVRSAPRFVMVFPRHLHGKLAGLGARVGEEDGVGEGVLDQLVGQRLLLGDLVEIREVPDLVRLLGQRRDQLRVRMSQHVHRDARPEVEESAPVLLDQPGAFALHEVKRRARIGRQDGGDHVETSDMEEP
jgi:hypothetical protein